MQHFRLFSSPALYEIARRELASVFVVASSPRSQRLNSYSQRHFRACAVFQRPVSGRVTSGVGRGDVSLLESSEAAREDCEDLVVVPGFVSEEEERLLLQEVRRTLRGKKYLYDHWDGVRLL